MKNEKLNLINLAKNEICKENLKSVNGGTACAACWSDYEKGHKVGGYDTEQKLNALHTGDGLLGVLYSWLA